MKVLNVSLPASSSNTFAYLFYNANKLISAEHLVLPATELASECYRSMFQEETWDYLIECPNCGKYVYMRNHCSSCGQKLAYTNTNDLLCRADEQEW